MVAGLFIVATTGVAVQAARQGRARVELLLRTRVERVVAGTGVRAEIRGQHVVLTGAAIDEPHHDVIVQQVDDVPGVVGVRDAITVGRGAIRPASGATQPVLRAEITNGRVVLSGLLPGSVPIPDVVGPLVVALGRDRVEDRLQAGAGVDPELARSFGALVVAAGPVITRGSVLLAGSSVVLLGTVSSTIEKQSLLTSAASLSRTWRVVDALRAETIGTPTSFDVSGLQSVQAKLVAVQGVLDNLVADVPMTFDARGRLDALSGVVLDEVARQFADENVIEATIIVRADPVTFADADKALAWSQAQAQRIVGELKDRGILAGRLSAQGVGLENPRPDESPLPVRILVQAPTPPTTTSTTQPGDSTPITDRAPGSTKPRKRSRRSRTSSTRSVVTTPRAAPARTVPPSGTV